MFMFFYIWMMIQVICENLPISSSGHVALLHRFINPVVDYISITDVQAFDDLLQGASVLVFFLFFFRSWWQLVIQQPIDIALLFDTRVWKYNILPALRFGFVVDAITALFWSLNIKCLISMPLAGGFFITALVLYVMRYAQEKKDIEVWSMYHAVILGCAQGCALLPGISRFAITVGVLHLLGYKKLDAFSISFFVQWPLIFAGSFKGFLQLRGTEFLTNILTIPFLLAIVCCMIISYGVMYQVRKLVEKNYLWKFAYYMMIPLAIALFL